MISLPTTPTGRGDPTVTAHRVHLPALENKQPWFAALLDAFAFLDACLEAEVAAGGRAPACRAGCYACCCQPIPVSLAELMGVRAYVREFSGADHQEAGGTGGASLPVAIRCPFLEGGRCGIYPVRPFACRRFLVFTTPCLLEEDPTVTRPGDVLAPSRHALLHALRMTLPVYRALGGIHVQGDEGRDFFSGHTVLLQTVEEFRGRGTLRRVRRD